MKQRLLVMNGQRLVQVEREGQWATEKIDKAAGLKPGIYNIHLAVAADKAKIHVGAVVHIEQGCVYQQTPKGFVRHAVQDFDKVPEIGALTSIRYAGDAAEVSLAPLGRRLRHGMP